MNSNQPTPKETSISDRYHVRVSVMPRSSSPLALVELFDKKNGELIFGHAETMDNTLKAIDAFFLNQVGNYYDEWFEKTGSVEELVEAILEHQMPGTFEGEHWENLNDITYEAHSLKSFCREQLIPIMG